MSILAAAVGLSFPRHDNLNKLITVLSGAGTVILLKQQIKRSPAEIITITVILRGGGGGVSWTGIEVW